MQFNIVVDLMILCLAATEAVVCVGAGTPRLVAEQRKKWGQARETGEYDLRHDAFLALNLVDGSREIPTYADIHLDGSPKDQHG